MVIRSAFPLLLSVLLAEPASAQVFLRWTEPTVPLREALGVSDLVIPWTANLSPALGSATKQGYRVYAEATLAQAKAAADTGAGAGITGIIVKIGDSEQQQASEAIPKLRSAYPKLTFLILRPGGKQPRMRGSIVVKRDGILEVSSPTAQPWIDSNVALVKFERALHPDEVPLFSFPWDLSDPGERFESPSASDYSVAVAEAGAFHADVILDLPSNLQKALARNNGGGWAVWNQVKRTIRFYSGASARPVETDVNVGVVTDSYETSYEATNLMARHNIPFRVLHPADLIAQDTRGLGLIVVFAALDKQVAEAINAFATARGTALLVNLHGSYPWQSAGAKQTGEHSTSTTVGKGRIVEITEPVADPEAFAEDVRRLLGKNAPISLWNALTTLAFSYQGSAASDAVLELVNYAADPLPVQVRIKGSYSHIRYETPERGCCETLTPTHRNGFTEFVVPWLRIGGRVHLSGSQGSALK